MNPAGIAVHVLLRFLPVWIALAAILAPSILLRRRLGPYGRLMESSVGQIGLGLVLFWILTALFADLIVTGNPLEQISGMKNALPGTAVPGKAQFYLLGGYNLARDVFSRMVVGS